MAFLPNTGNIILDAVLTDAGRRRLAKGDGSFNITKFALGDAEINYNLFDFNAGAAYNDLNILKTPIFEAFTDSSMAMSSRLMTLIRRDHLYLNSIILNTLNSTGQPLAGGSNADMYVLICTTNAYEKYANLPDGHLDARDVAKAAKKENLITLHQGLNTTAIDFKLELDPVLTENQMIVQVDHRFFRLVVPDPARADLVPSFIDDDNVATYYIINNAANAAHWGPSPGGAQSEQGDSGIDGPRGPTCAFGIRCQTSLQSNTRQFTDHGGTLTDEFASGDHALYIDSMVTVMGNQTGARIDFPIRALRED